nr:hypothetical protein CFP56_12916 [Quercus suber]
MRFQDHHNTVSTGISGPCFGTYAVSIRGKRDDSICSRIDVPRATVPCNIATVGTMWNLGTSSQCMVQIKTVLTGWYELVCGHRFTYRQSKPPSRGSISRDARACTRQGYQALAHGEPIRHGYRGEVDLNNRDYDNRTKVDLRKVFDRLVYRY